MSNRISPENRELANTIRDRIAKARQAETAAVLHYKTFAIPSPTSYPHGVRYDLTNPEAMAANNALYTTSKAVRSVESLVTSKCPKEEREPCPRCAGEGKVWRHSNVCGGVCFKCNGRSWLPRNRWIRACMPE